MVAFAGTATIGLLSSVTVGVLLVNLASRRHWTQWSKMQTGTSERDKQGLTNPDERPIAGLATVSGDSIDTMAWHLTIVGIAILMGYTVKQAMVAASPSLGGSFPLFPLAMLAGQCDVRVLPARFCHLRHCCHRLHNRPVCTLA